MQEYNITVPAGAHKMRLDALLSNMIAEKSRAKVQQAIKLGYVKINSMIVTDNALSPRESDIIVISFPDPPKFDIKPCDIKLNIVYEDQDLIVINKSAGMSSHPGAGTREDTLVHALRYHTSLLSNIGGETRPGIVHRLDKDTSGLMVVAKNDYAHTHLAAQIQSRSLIRKYKALVWGVINPTSGTIIHNIGRSKLDRKKMTTVKYGGKHAVTHYNTERLLFNGAISLVECKLDTGRTHQIRVHLSHMKHSIVGDQTYGQNSRKLNASDPQIIAKLENFKRQALHSWYISFVHPTKNDIMEFDIPLAEDILEIIS